MSAPVSWEYSGHVNARDVEVACGAIIARALADKNALGLILEDTRESHREMFATVTPPGHEYFAGNYRGSGGPMLISYDVHIPVNGKYYPGQLCGLVASAMDGFHRELNVGINNFRARSLQLQWDARKKIIAFAKLVGALFVKFLSIHPYANGNGHISRLLVWAVFAVNSISSVFWDVSKRNIEPPDIQVAQYRDGYTEALVQTFIKLIAEANPGMA